jgi:cytochrome o ubiquinol oxidase subunit 2
MKTKLLLLFLALVDIGIVIYLLASQSTLAILNPAGPIAAQERDLLALATLLAASIVIPVFILFFIISASYKLGHKKIYAPSWTPKKFVTLLWWIIPAIVIFILAYNTWFATHTLDPYKPLESKAKPVTIQVVALQWKWLFIYPEEGIATVNFVQFPEDRPINFMLTADAPMNSFWIPQLSGQIYAMTGMSTKLHVLAEKPGDYAGSAAEISGTGFSSMRFTARASTEADFNAWVKTVKESSKHLTNKEYDMLAQPSDKFPVTVYASTATNLYNSIVMKFMPSPPLPANVADKAVPVEHHDMKGLH